MTETLASFRDLKGIGPATEARLHAAGVFSWPALAAVLAALGSVRGNGRDPLRGLAEQAAERASAGGGESEGERTEAFILRVAVDDQGRTLRTVVTHVRSQAEERRAGWAPGEIVGFLEDCLRHGRPRSTDAADATDGTDDTDDGGGGGEVSEGAGSCEHAVDLDAGKLFGGAPQNVGVTLGVGPSTPGFDFVATLTGRAYGGSRSEGSEWIALARRSGRGERAEHLALRFDAVPVPDGLHRLRLRMELTLPEPCVVAPELELL